MTDSVARQARKSMRFVCPTKIFLLAAGALPIIDDKHIFFSAPRYWSMPGVLPVRIWGIIAVCAAPPWPYPTILRYGSRKNLIRIPFFVVY